MLSVQQRIRRRLNWYKSRFQVNNPVVGRAVEIFGDKVRMDGLVYSVATPQISLPHKGTLAFGLHEMEERELIRAWLPPGLPVIEFGGGLGVVSCLTNKRLLDPTKHTVVEANPAMIPILTRNRSLNGCKFEILNNALAYGAEYIDLNIDSEFVGSTVKASTGNVARVRTMTVEAILDSRNFNQAGIICDIEGAEADLIRNELPSLGDRIQFLRVEMHPGLLGTQPVDALMSEMRTIGFLEKQQLGDCIFYARGT